MVKVNTMLLFKVMVVVGSLSAGPIIAKEASKQTGKQISKALVKDDFVAATPIKNSNRSIPRERNRSDRLEGWAMLSYIIDTDGLVKEVVAVDVSSKGDYVTPSLKHLRSLRFTPATRQGKPVVSTRTQFISHKVTLYGSNNEGISPSFSKRYNAVDKLLGQQQFAEAKAPLAELQDTNTYNLTEQALSAWLHSIYYASQNDWPAYGQSVKNATYLRAYMPTKMAIRTSQNLLEWHKFKNQPADAIRTLYRMTDIDNAEIDQQTHQAMLLPLLQQIDEQPEIKINTTLNQAGAWLHMMSRSVFSLDFNQGELQKVELRCDDHWQPLVAAKVDKFIIPQSDYSCSVLVTGRPGAEITFVEQGERRAFIDAKIDWRDKS